MSPDLDIVLFGATGFVGRLTAAYLAEHAPAGLSVGLAGRDRHRLEALRRQLPHPASTWEILVADAGDADALGALAARTRVVATTVGPYWHFGMPLVAACAQAGTHYCDITGEVLFVRASADDWHARAAETGARIIHACGFDSIPSDLGVLVTADAAAEAGDGQLTRTLLSVRSLRGRVGGGTVDTMRQQALAARHSRSARAILADSYALSPDRAAEPVPTRDGSTSGHAPAGLAARARAVAGAVDRRVPVHRDGQTRRWTGPFVMAGFNTRIVRRSNALLGWRYGREFRYREVSDFGAGALAPVRAAGMTAALAGIAVGVAYGPTRAVLDRILPKPGEGPPPEVRAVGRFGMHIEAETTSGAAWRTWVRAELDPSFEGTALMLGESALALALDGDRLPQAAGVLTPATALGRVLVDRLVAQGVTIETTRIAG